MTIGRPVVSVVGSGETTTVVEIDDDYVARRATEHLIALGHRDIAFLGGGSATHWAQVDRRRLNGYVAAMEDAGLSDHVAHIVSDVTLPGGYASAVDALGDARSRPTAIVGDLRRGGDRRDHRRPPARSPGAERSQRHRHRRPRVRRHVLAHDAEAVPARAGPGRRGTAHRPPGRSEPGDEGRADAGAAGRAQLDLGTRTRDCPPWRSTAASTATAEGDVASPARGCTKAPDAASGAFVW